MINLVAYALASYIITILIVEGAIFARLREYVRQKTPWLFAGGVHLLDCRLCVGCYVSGIVVALGSCYQCDFRMIDFSFNPLEFFITYGASYFLATQER
jgi:hypothetical protein